MRRFIVAAAAVVLNACTAGGVAVQGQGLLIPAAGHEVGFHAPGCKRYYKTTTSDGRFTFYGYNDANQLIPAGDVFVTVKDLAVSGPGKLYRFNHVYDNTCQTGPTSSTQCVKYLFMLTGSYDDQSANAPPADVKVKFPEATGSAAHLAFSQYNILCNLR